jgi:hypothetical protein
MEEIKLKKDFIFNSPLEIALRLLFIFKNATAPLDLQRLVYYQYLLIHSGDIPEAPKSIHPNLPTRSCEMLINRKILKKSLTLLVLKDLVAVKYSKKNGIQYAKNKQTDVFVNYLESSYSKLLEERANWLCSKFDSYTDKQLSQLINYNLEQWGSEFSPIKDEVYDDI